MKPTTATVLGFAVAAAAGVATLSVVEVPPASSPAAPISVTCPDGSAAVGTTVEQIGEFCGFREWIDAHASDWETAPLPDDAPESWHALRAGWQRILDAGSIR